MMEKRGLDGVGVGGGLSVFFKQNNTKDKKISRKLIISAWPDDSGSVGSV